MANPLYQMFNSQPQQAPAQPSIFDQIAQFKNNFQGDPREKVMSMLNNGQITQAQYNQAVQQANQLYSMMHR